MDVEEFAAAVNQLPTRRLPALYRRWQRLQARRSRGAPVDRLAGQLRQESRAGAAELADLPEPSWQLDYPSELPVSGQRDAVVAALKARGLLVLTGETGSGKTTQLPKMLIEAGYARRGRLAVTQPRRLAAVSVAARLAEECRVGPELIAHAVRFDDATTDATRVVVQTDGLLLAELARDPWLSRYDAVILDEAHERSCNIDLLLALLLRLRRMRPDLALVVTSATIDAERFATHLGDDAAPAPLVQVSGRLYPVTRQVFAAASDDDLGYLAAMVECVREQHASGMAGDMLCFLPTERDILEARRRLADLPGATVLPCFGRLTAAEQQRIFQPCPGRKVVLATPIAETSLTIPGITMVIDSGLARRKRYQAHSRTERLPVEPVARASLDQRAGRAGRLGPGVYWQLFSHADAESRPPFSEPEIKRSNLAGVLLQVLHAGHGDPEALPWLDPPSSGDWQQAWRLLAELGAVDEQRLTALGRRLAQMPLDPQVARVCLAGIEEGVVHEALTVAAFISTQDPRLRPLGEEAQADAAQAGFLHEAGDMATVLNLWQAWAEQPSSSARGRWCRRHYMSWRRMREWADLRRQLWQTVARMQRDLPPRGHPAAEWPLDRVHRAVLAGMLGMVLKWDAEQRCYRGAGNRLLAVHPSSALRRGRDRRGGKQAPPWPAWLVACEVVETSRSFARLCAPIAEEWIAQLAGNRLRIQHSEPYWDAAAGRVVVDEQRSWLGLALGTRRAIAAERVIGPAAAEALFIDQALAGDGLQRPPAVLRENRALIAEAQTVMIRLRDRSLVIAHENVVAAYSHALARLERGPQPRPLTSVAALRRLLREMGDQALRLQPRDICPQLLQARREYPLQVRIGPGLQCPVSYVYNHGAEDDGATLTVAEADCQRLQTWRLQRCIPGLLRGQVEHWLGRLRKAQRQQLAAQDDHQLTICMALDERSDPLPQAFAAVVGDLVHAPIAVPAYQALPPWLRLRVRVVAADDRVLSATRELDLLTGEQPDDPLAALRLQWETPPGPHWPGPIPETCGQGACRAYPALLRSRDQQAAVAVQRGVLASALAAAAWHADGLVAWLECGLQAELAQLAQQLASLLGDSAGGPGAAVVRAAALAIASGDERPPTIRDEAAAQDYLSQARQRLQQHRPLLQEWLRRLRGSLDTLKQYQRRGGKGLAALNAVSSVEQARQRLLGPGWWQQLPWWGMRWLPDWLDTLAAGLRAPGGLDPARATRAARVLADWQQCSMDRAAARACGMLPQWQLAAACSEECHAAILAGRRPRAPASELALRATIAELEATWSHHVEAWHQAARALRQLAPALRNASGPLAAAAEREIDRVLALGLDTSHGADIASQPAQLQALAQRARRLC